MKKLLIATSALVASVGVAHALDVTLGGEIEIDADFDLADSGFDGADWDAAITVKASGESMGWTYGGTLNLDMATAADVANGYSAMDLHVDSATIYMGASFMGRVSAKDSCGNFVDSVADATSMDAANEVVAISGHCVEWTGYEIGGLELMGAASLDNSNDLIVGAKYLNPELGLLNVEYDVDNERWDAEIGTIVAGTTIAVGLDYNDTEGSYGDYDYVVSAKGEVSGFTWGLAYSPTAALSGDSKNYTDAAAAAFPTFGFNDTPDGDTSGNKALAASLGYDCVSMSLAFDLESIVDTKYEAISAAQFVQLNAVLTAAGKDTVSSGHGKQGLLASWEIEADCEIHDDVSLTASIGASSKRAAALAALNSAKSSLADYGANGSGFGGQLTRENSTSSAIAGSVGMKISF